MDVKLLHQALDHLNAGDFKVGPEMEQAHEICQMFEGVPMFDWVHAVVHRIEGDDPNADYWYRRAGRTRHAGAVAEEVQKIRDAVPASNSVST